MDTTKPPFDDIRVRQAMQNALDLENMNLTYYKGQADWTPRGGVTPELAAQGMTVPYEEWSPELKAKYAYDPELAERLLDEAGYPRGPDGTANYQMTSWLAGARADPDPLGHLGMFIIPSLILGTALSAATMRMTRAMMLEVLRQDYIRTAWSKGLRERIVVIRHAIKNALIPVVTLIGLQLPILVGGAVIMENIFNLPGLGRLMLTALTDRGYPVISGINLFFATMVVAINLVIDLIYGYLHPRVRYRIGNCKRKSAYGGYARFRTQRQRLRVAAPAGALAAAADAPQAAAAPATDHPASADAPQTDPVPATDRATRDARDKQAAMGRAARDVERRMLASAGLLTEAKPTFAEPAHAVAHGGVLAALPMLLREGLLGAANRLLLSDDFERATGAAISAPGQEV